MDVQLGGDIAQGADVQLVDREAQNRADRSNGRAGQDDLFHELDPMGRIQLLDLPQAGLARDQHQPRIAGVILQPHLAQGQVRHLVRGRHEGRIDLKISHAWEPPPNSRSRE